MVPQKALGALHVGSPNLKSPSRAASERYAQVIDIMLNQRDRWFESGSLQR
jgi:hypothetical protein